MKNVRRLQNVSSVSIQGDVTSVLKASDREDVAAFAWISALPIAGALFKAHKNVVERVIANTKFDELVLGYGRASGLSMANIADKILTMADEKRSTHFECWRSDDMIQPRELEISIAQFGTDSDLFLLSMFDRTAEAISQSNLRREMLSDSLTGFCNRTGFEEQVEDAVMAMLSSGVTASYAIILVDLARFSRVNESVGAMAGDELIITVARRLNARIRSHEILGRLGSNEFALFVQLDHDDADIARIAARLNDAFVEPCKLSNLEIQVECALAGAVGIIGQEEPTDTLRHAQIALKRAKATKTFEIYAAGSVDMERRRFSLETDLRRALKRGELELHYQPLVDLDSGSLSGFEALARWDHPDLGPISPVDFIPVAEESGLIVPLGRWALEQAAQTIAKWDERIVDLQEFRISVNMSAVQMQRDDVVDAVSGALKGAGISGNRMTIELTESAFINDPAGAKNLLDALKGMHTDVAMDDFGTGYSNLAFLQQLPIDVLKIDRSFVTEMTINKDKRAIVRAVLSLARALGMKTTAEGIESEEISIILRRLGCSVGQGFYYARPLTEDNAYAFLMADKAVLIA